MRRNKHVLSHKMTTITGNTSRFAAESGIPVATATLRSVKFCVRAAHTRVTQKYDGCTAQRAQNERAQNGCVRSQLWEAA
jgi:hypothetical protein